MSKILSNSLVSISCIKYVFFFACQNSESENSMKAVQNLGSKNFYSSVSRKNFGWQKNVSCNFDKENFSLLLQSKVPAIRLENFLSKQETSTLATNIKAATFGTYEDTYPPIGKIGITQYEHSKKNKKAYFDRVHDSYKEVNEIFSGINIIKKLQTELSKIGYQSNIAHEHQKYPYFCGLIRNISGDARIHFDYAKYDGPNWNIGNVINQVAFNTYIQLPQEGGETITYDKIWEPGIYEKFLIDDGTSSYGFKKDLVKNTKFFTIKPFVGDLWLFNSRNFHEVLSSKGKDRFSVSCFIGQVENDKQNLLLWS